MPDWAAYVIVLLAGIVIGRLTGRRSDAGPRLPPTPPRPLPADAEARVQALLRERRKIDAIKVYREATGSGLKEAKEAVEAIQARMP